MTPEAAPQTPPVPVGCMDGPMGGQTLAVGTTHVFVAQTLALWIIDNNIAFATAEGHAIYIDGQPQTRGYLQVGQRFFFNGSNWQVGVVAPPAPAAAPQQAAPQQAAYPQQAVAPQPGVPAQQAASKQAAAALDYVAGNLMRAAGTDKLEGFSLKDMFSEVFKKRAPEEVEDHFLVGTSRTTPALENIDTSWPKPWFFFRILAFVGLLYLGFSFAWKEFHNTNLIPGLILTGSFAMPMATLFLFFELNTPRNVSFHKGLSLFCVGGLVSIFISLIGFSMSNLGWLGASSAGIIEEIGKFLTVLIIVRLNRYKYILNGLFFGAAVGAGFAAFESAGYAFNILLGGGIEAMSSNIMLRGLLAPFGHVAWTAITAGAFFRTKGDRPFNASMLFAPAFLRAFLIPVAIHMIWNASIIPSPFWIKHLALGVAGWFVVFGLVQQGLRQVREDQQRVTSQHRAVAATGALTI